MQSRLRSSASMLVSLGAAASSLSLFAAGSLAVTGVVMMTSSAAMAAAEPRDAKQYNLSKSKLAIDGYDPVAYFPEGGSKPAKGSDKFQETREGVTYRFVNQKNLDAFKANPAKYEPAHGGWCSYAMGTNGEKVEIDPKSYVVSDGRLFLFYKDLFTDTRSTWLKETAKLLPKADASWKKFSGESPRDGKVSAAPAAPSSSSGSLQSQLDAKSAEYAAKAPPAVMAVYDKGIADVAASGVLATALNIGDKAPDFTLPGVDGKPVKLSDMLAKGPVVVTWYRGGWCPFCNIQLHAYQEAMPELKAAGGSLIAISPELPDNTMSTAEKNQLAFPVLSDAGNKAAKSYGLAYRLPDDLVQAFKGRLDIPKMNGDESWELPLAATYVIGRDSKIVYRFVEADYRKRAEPSEIIEAVRKASNG